MAEKEPEGGEDTSLRDALNSAFEQAESADAPPEQEEGSEKVASDRPRDERGRWTKAQREHFEAQQSQREAAAAGQEGQPQKPQEQAQQKVEEDPNGGGIVLAPPHGWSPAAKAEFAKLSPAVQEAVARREIEINNGFKKLQDYKGLEDAAEMARASGTTLREAFDRYRAAEDALDRDFFGGVMQLAEMYGWHPMQLAQQIAAAYNGQGAERVPQAMDPQSALIAQRLAGMEETIRTLTSERERAEQEAINSHLEEFAQKNLCYEDVRKDMALLIREGRANSLEQAYDMACWANPEIRDLLIKERAAPQETQQRISQAKRASGGLPTGAPVGNAAPGSSANSIRAALADAWDQASI